jgi:hypothetical protein
MKTYPHIREDGTISYFEISNTFPWSWGFMRRVLASVQGVSDLSVPDQMTTALPLYISVAIAW